MNDSLSLIPVPSSYAPSSASSAAPRSQERCFSLLRFPDERQDLVLDSPVVLRHGPVKPSSEQDEAAEGEGGRKVRRVNETEEEFRLRQGIRHEKEFKYELNDAYEGKEDTLQTARYALLIPDINAPCTFKVARLHRWVDFRRVQNVELQKRRMQEVLRLEQLKKNKRKLEREALKAAEEATATSVVDWGGGGAGRGKRKVRSSELQFFVGESNDKDREEEGDEDGAYDPKTRFVKKTAKPHKRKKPKSAQGGDDDLEELIADKKIMGDEDFDFGWLRVCERPAYLRLR